MSSFLLTKGVNKMVATTLWVKQLRQLGLQAELESP